jgi:predicted metal-binding membrane protein
MSQETESPDPRAAGFMPVVLAHPAALLLLLGISAAAWGALAWLAMDMGTPLARLVMPMFGDWSEANLLAVWGMWSVMMVAMMLPSALPMILTFVQVAQRNGERARAHAFVTAYVLVWLIFGIAGTAAQWALQRWGALDEMALSASALPTAVLLVVAGLYQFSPLQHLCLASCRTPLGFLIGEWRAGVAGAFRMGIRHGLLCLGCCWALMALLFVGGVMNLAWVAALAFAVAIEKIAPAGERMGVAMGWGLIAIGAVKLATFALG